MNTPDYYGAEPDIDWGREDAVAEAEQERRARRDQIDCQCDVDWGTCPGPQNCPCSGYYDRGQ